MSSDRQVEQTLVERQGRRGKRLMVAPVVLPLLAAVVLSVVALCGAGVAYGAPTQIDKNYECTLEYSTVQVADSWAIGNCHKGEKLEGAASVEPGKPNNYHWIGGWIGGGFSGCGWIEAKNYKLKELGSQPATICASVRESSESPPESEFIQYIPKEKRYNVGRGLKNEKGEEEVDGVPVVNAVPCKEYANYRPWSTANVEKEPVGEVPAYTPKEAGSRTPALLWRYVTIHESTDETGRYVMVDDQRYNTPFGKAHWVFVPKSCLPTNLPQGAGEKLPESPPPPPPTIGTIAFQANNGLLYTYSPGTGPADLNEGMLPKTSPSIALEENGSQEIAFQANNNLLYTYSSIYGASDLGEGMNWGTSPSITAMPGNGCEIAFQANNGLLYTYSSIYGASDLNEGMMYGTSPSVAYLENGSIEIAFQANNGLLYTYSSLTGAFDTGEGMMAKTSPSITALSGGGYEIAFQANNGLLYTYNSATGPADMNEGMEAETSPSIAGLAGAGYYEIAFQANNGYLYTYDSGTGPFDTGQGMMAKTSPGISALSGGGYEIAFQANTGVLYSYTYGIGGADLNEGMELETGPSIGD